MVNPMPDNQPTREELIDALKRAAPRIGAVGGETLADYERDRDIIESVLAKAEPKPRRWVIRFDGDYSQKEVTMYMLACAPLLDIRELKPITLERIQKACEAVPGHLSCELLIIWLRELGIEVED